MLHFKKKKAKSHWLASPELPTSHVKNALESRQIFEMRWGGERGHGEGNAGGAAPLLTQCLASFIKPTFLLMPSPSGKVRQRT